MQSWRLTVWTRFRAPVEAVWDLKTDPLALAREFLPWIRVEAKDVDGLRRALRQTGKGTFPGRVTGPLGLIGVAWPFSIQGTEPPRWYRDGSSNLLYADFQHEHRFEPIPGGGCRYVDEVVFTPRAGPSRLSAELTRALFVHRHHRAARELPVEPDAVAHTWLRPALERRPVDVAAPSAAV